MASFPSVPISNVFNTLDYNEIIEGSLSLSEADARYFKLIGGSISGLTTFLAGANVIGTLSINGSPVDLSLITGVIPGTPTNGKALSLDASGDINGNISLTGTLTAATSVSSSIINSNQYLLAGSSILMSALTGITLGTPQASKALTLNASSEITGNITINRTAGGLSVESIRCINGTTSFRVFQTFNGTTFIGNTTATDLSFTTSNTSRMNISGNTGAISGISSLTAINLTASTLATINTALINIASINNLTNYNGNSNTAHLVIRQPSNTNGNKCAIDFMIDTSTIDASITAGASIVHERSGTGSLGSLIFSTKRVAGTGTVIVEALRIKSSGSCTIANTTGTDYQLDLGGTGTGINTGSLKFDGTTFNHAYFTDITTGSGDALKALVPNSDKDISGLRDLSITGALISGSVDAASYALSGASMLASALTNNIAGTAIANKALVIDASRNIRIPNGSTTTGHFRFYGDTAGKEELLMYRASDDSGLTIATKANGVQKSSPLLSLYSGLDLTNAGAGTSSAGYGEVIRSNHKLIGIADNYQSGWFHGYLNATPPWKASGFQYCTQFYTSMEALNITCGTSSTNSITTSNNILMQNNGKIYFNTTNRSIQSNTTFLFNGSSVVRGLGDWLEGTSQVVQEWRNSNNATIMRMYIPNTGICDFGTQSNDGLSLMTNNTRRMTITNAGRVGINTDIPTCGLDVATGENSVLFTTNIMVNTYSYQISSNIHANFGGGPFSANICARFRGSVWIQDRLWATSDRRLKKDIEPIDFSLDHYKLLNPVSYKWKNSEQIQLGLIAQEVKNVCSEAVSIVENKNMKVETEDDIEGAQYTVDYNAINMMNVIAIKKLIERVEQLEKKLLK